MKTPLIASCCSPCSTYAQQSVPVIRFTWYPT
jgi:hypothetical protein